MDDKSRVERLDQAKLWRVSLIPYSRQSIGQEDINSVVEALSQKLITQGPQVKNFETSVCQVVNSKFASACNSATSGLHMACMALGVTSTDIVWTSAISFVASANAARYCGAQIDFVDIDPVTNNISIELLKKKLKAASVENRLPKCLIVVHLSGLPCDLREISFLAKEYDFRVIEDASHALGASYFGAPIGSGEYSDMCVFSFHAVKIITTAEGGVVTTNCSRLAEKLNILRSHGIVRDGNNNDYDVPPEIFYRQVTLGYNYRMSEMGAALGISQIKKLETFSVKRQKIFERYQAEISNDLVALPVCQEDRVSSNHLFVIKLKALHRHNARNLLFEEFSKQGIQTNLHYIPIFLHPDFEKYRVDKKHFPNSMEYFQNALSIPMFPDMTQKQIDKVINILNDFRV